MKNRIRCSGFLEKKAFFLAVIGMGLLCLPVLGLSAAASETASIPVVFSIPEFSSVRVQDNLLPLKTRIGLGETQASLLFFLTATGNKPRMLMGKLGMPLPSGLTLTVEILSPHSGQSAGPQVMGTGEVELMSGFSGIYELTMRGLLKIRADNNMSPGDGQVALLLYVRDM